MCILFAIWPFLRLLHFPFLMPLLADSMFLVHFFSPLFLYSHFFYSSFSTRLIPAHSVPFMHFLVCLRSNFFIASPCFLMVLLFRIGFFSSSVLVSFCSINTNIIAYQSTLKCWLCCLLCCLFLFIIIFAHSYDRERERENIFPLLVKFMAN